MSAGEDIDVARLAAELEWIVPGFCKLQALEKFGTGQSNPTYLLQAASGRYVLRTKPPGVLLKSAHQVDREFRVMKTLNETAVPVPAMLALSEGENALGRTYFVMEHLDGRVFWDPALPDCPPQERAAIYDAMNATLAALHSLDPAAVGLSDFGKPGNYFVRQLKRWSEQYRASETERIPDMDALIEWLEAHLPPDDGVSALVHGDYRIDNIMFADDRPEIIAVLDWELSTLGHPLADLAYQCMQWRLPYDSAFRGLGGLDRAALGLSGEEAYVESYCARRGLGDIDHWPFYLAFSFFRLAAILQGVMKRAIDGNASNPERARQMGDAVPLLASLALDVTREAA
ncbi:MAG TPA: phosphotransferase family protein [Pararhizobium sp.]|nr:phosphotransferase family protein [Pararhizobium sp.]